MAAVTPTQDDVAKRWINYDRVLDFAIPILAILASFVIGGIFLLMLGVDPIEAYTALVKGAFGNPRLITTTIIKTVPLIFTGLAVTLAYRGGVFNIGAEGQLYFGALFAVWAGTTLVLPYPWHMIAALFFGIGGGMIWGFIPGILKAKRDMNEIIVTILMNYIAIFTVSYFVHGPLKEEGWNTQTPPVAETAKLPPIMEGTRLHTGLFLALLAVAVVYILLFHTTLGYRIRMVGTNIHAARFSGIRAAAVMALAMALSGGLAGMAGAVEILAVQQRLIDNFSPGWGFDGIAVALVGRLHPIGALFAAFFFGAMRSGANSMQTAVRVDVVVVYIVQGLSIVFLIAGTSAKARRWLDKWMLEGKPKPKDAPLAETANVAE